jgi:diguanylate cyclase (GGDEF)-like protein/PAS domain S-box-containing protein
MARSPSDSGPSALLRAGPFNRPIPHGLTLLQVIDSMLEAVMITDPQGLIQTVNSAFCSITGHSAEEVIGRNPRVLKSGRHANIFYKKMWASVISSGSWQGEICNRRKNGELYTEWLTISRVRNDRGEVTHYVGVFTDITKRKRAEEKIRHMAYYDALTDLPNRTLFRDRLTHALTHAEQTHQHAAVLFVDLDRVKLINDSLGHDVGDHLLKGVAGRLSASLREQDTVARLGGDEFMILLTDLHHSEDASPVAKKILESLKPPFHIDKHELYVTASVGVSLYPRDGSDAGTLLKNADTAMYRAKSRGRNTFEVFTPEMKVEMSEQHALANSLRRALEREEFSIHYQPQVSVRTGELIGMEALLRWNHPELGLISPDQFIRWAEDTGLIVPLGEWVLKKACEQNRLWQKVGHRRLVVAVNLSARQFQQPDIVETISSILEETGLDPSFLDLELTESVVMESAGPALETPHELKALGVQFSIDDFGIGYSSLSYLKRFPVDTLKMDRSFVNDLATDPNDAAIATAVVALGHGLNLSVLAEGVETRQQLAFLQTLKCDKIQGFLYSRPLPPEAFEQFLREGHPLDLKTSGHRDA